MRQWGFAASTQNLFSWRTGVEKALSAHRQLVQLDIAIQLFVQPWRSFSNFKSSNPAGHLSNDLKDMLLVRLEDIKIMQKKRLG